MNAVVGLCHFCEIHGPRVVFCCQPYHDNSVTGEQFGSESSPFHRQFYGCYEDLSRATTSGTEDKNAAEWLTNTCEACRSSAAPGKPIFLCNDHANRTSFVSSQQPFHPDVFNIVRQSCLRSLSCEVCPDREGPIFYGSDAQGYTVSHTFVLKDSKARGFQHFYSFIVVSVDKLLLLNSFDFIVKCLRSVIEELQWKAMRVYDSEQSVCSEKSLRMAAGSRYATLPANFLRQRVSSGGSPRSFGELTGDKEIFRRLHRYCVWILRAVPQRLTEKMLEGSPTEDVIVAMEQLELDESPQLERKDFDSPDGLIDKMSRDDSFSPTPFEQPQIGELFPLTANLDCVANLRHLTGQLGLEKFRQLVTNLVVGNQIVLRCDRSEVIREFIDSLRFLIPFGCAKSIYFGDRYEESYKANLLGLTTSVPVPTALLHSGHVVVISGVVVKVLNDESEPFGETSVTMQSCQFSWDSVEQVPRDPRCLTIVRRYMAILTGDVYSLALAESAIFSVREEWLNRAKVFFCFTRRTSSQPTPEEFASVRLALKTTETDDLLLKFWTAGLSRQYKMFVLNGCRAEKAVEAADSRWI